MWEHPIVKERETKSLYNTIFNEIKSDDTKFFNYMRMSKTSFYELLHILENDLLKKNTWMRNSIPPEEKLVITLR